MGLIKAKQVNIGTGTPFSGSFTAFISSSVAAAGFASRGEVINNQWTLNGTTLFTSQSYNTQITGSLTVFGNSPEVFIVKNHNETQNLLTVKSSGIVQLYVNELNPTSSAEYGQLYFTSSSLFLGIT
jgi:hypothetical protein